MTIIVGVAGDDYVALASDSYAVDETDRRWHHPDKIRTFLVDGENVLIGVAGRAALVTVLRSHLKIDGLPTVDADLWAQEIATSITQLAVEYKIVDREERIDGQLLLAWRNRLWDVSDYLALPVKRWSTSGAGSLVALGALEALDYPSIAPRVLARQAAEIACKHISSCIGPVIVHTTDPASPSA